MYTFFFTHLQMQISFRMRILYESEIIVFRYKSKSYTIFEVAIAALSLYHIIRFTYVYMHKKNRKLQNFIKKVYCLAFSNIYCKYQKLFLLLLYMYRLYLTDAIYKEMCSCL